MLIAFKEFKAMVEERETERGPEEDFAELLKRYDKQGSETLQVGDRIRGSVLGIGKDAVFVDTGTKVDGVVEKAELLEDGNLPVQKGDVLELYVVAIGGGEIRLSKALAGPGPLYVLQEAQEGGVPVEGKVTGVVKGGYTVTIMQRRAFCPLSQMDLRPVEDPSQMVGQTHLFLVTQLDEGGRNIVVSRRRLLDRENRAARERFLAELAVGAEVDARVVKLMPYGAFVELVPGLEGLVHLSELSWAHVDNAAEVLHVGQVVRAKLMEMQPDTKSGGWRLSLSLRQLTADPWETVGEHLEEGGKYDGKVIRCAPFGLFIELRPGIEGLAHISELSYVKRVTRPEEIAVPGDTVSVVVKEIDRVRRRIALSLKDAGGQDDPWRNIETRYAVGQAVEGRVERREKFGVFVNLEPGVTGLLPQSRFANGPAAQTARKWSPGDSVRVVIEELQPEQRRVTLNLGEGAETTDWRAHVRKGEQQSLGSLGERFKEALASRAKAKR